MFTWTSTFQLRFLFVYGQSSFWMEVVFSIQNDFDDNFEINLCSLKCYMGIN